MISGGKFGWNYCHKQICSVYIFYFAWFVFLPSVLPLFLSFLLPSSLLSLFLCLSPFHPSFPLCPFLTFLSLFLSLSLYPFFPFSLAPSILPSTCSTSYLSYILLISYPFHPSFSQYHIRPFYFSLFFLSLSIPSFLSISPLPSSLLPVLHPTFLFYYYYVLFFYFIIKFFYIEYLTFLRTCMQPENG